MTEEKTPHRPKPTVSINNDRFIIEMDDLPHIDITSVGIIGFQSWKKKDQDFYVIEYTYHNGTKIITDYDRREMWVDILKQLKGKFRS